jgi:hypothetical protein
MAEGGVMEQEPLNSETALREDIAMLREKIERKRRSLGALEEEVRKREAEFITLRVTSRMEEWEDE